MKYIDENFKDASPIDTVKKIKGILDELNINVVEKWCNSGVDNCFSLSIYADGGLPSSNGKGVTKELARASAYAEFIERLQTGIFLYKLQDIGANKNLRPNAFAPDAKYVTEEELIEDGDWMDYIAQSYGEKYSRKHIAKVCKLFSLDDKILTLPFYSLFEDKYVYMPLDFIEQMYTTNGCCVGNTKEEAWVHALSEIMERHASLKMLTSGCAAPAFSNDVLNKYPIVSSILKQIKDEGKLDVEILDYSIGNGFPVVASKVIDKRNQSYRINVAADPVFEIALQRTLTELMQGRNISQVVSKDKKAIFNTPAEAASLNNIMNQLESSSGTYCIDFFTNRDSAKKATVFNDNSKKTNKQLLKYVIELYRDLGKPVYVRNFSFLGFPCYKFIVPGFSETRISLLNDTLTTGLAKSTAKTLKDIKNADNGALKLFMTHSQLISTTNSRYSYFNRLSGLPFSYSYNWIIFICRSYAAYRLGQYDDAIKYLKKIINNTHIDTDCVLFFSCISRWLSLKQSGVDENKIKIILYAFFDKKYPEMLYNNINSGKTPFDSYLPHCDHNCKNCNYNHCCAYEKCENIIKAIKPKYTTFTNGQDKSEFLI